MEGRIEHRRADLKALELLRKSGDLIGADYPIFIGVTAIALVVGKLVPAYLLLGPMLCGVYRVYRKKAAGEGADFAELFRGFQHFLDGLIASLLMFLGTLAVVLPLSLTYALVLVAIDQAGYRSPFEDAPFAAIGATVGFLSSLFGLTLAIQGLFLFVFPLIADRGCDALTALRSGFSAAVANFWGVARLVLLNLVVCLLGLACCGVGVLFVVPFAFGASWLAYREVFPAETSPAEQATDAT